MGIRYALHKNKALAGEDQCVARVYSAGTIDYDDFIDSLRQGGSTVARSDAVAISEEELVFIEQGLANGFNVRTKTVTFSLEIQGTFEDESDHFDPRRHRLVVRAHVNKDLSEAVLNRAHFPAKIDAPSLAPYPRTLLDVVTKRRNSVLTAGGIATLTGSHLQFDETDPGQGIFLIGEDRSVTRITVVSANKRGHLDFLIPPLPEGPYRLAVRAAHGGEKVAAGFLDETLIMIHGQPELGEAAPQGLLPSG